MAFIDYYSSKSPDADLLDAIDSSQFLRSDVSDTMEGDLTIEGFLAAAQFITPYSNLVSVASEGADYDSIQDAIDSITDASVNNKYTVMVYPGTYTENITMKNYVSLVGLGIRRTTKIYGTSGTLVTMPDTEAHIFWIDLEMAPTLNTDVLLDCTAGAGATGFYRIENSDIIMTSAVEAIKPKLVDADCGVGLYLINVTLTYTMTGTTTTGIYNPINLQATNNLFYLLRSIARAYVGAANASLATVYDVSAGRFYAQITTMQAFFTNAANPGFCTPYAAYGGINTALKQIDASVVEVTGAGAGTGYVAYIDSATNNTTIDMSRNVYTVSGFTNNRKYYIGTGDTVRSYFNKSTVALTNFGAGTVQTIDLDSNADLNTNNSINIIADNEKLQVGAGNDGQFFHDGTNTYLNSDTGDFYIQHTANTATDTEHMYIKAVNEGAGNSQIYFQDDVANGGAEFALSTLITAAGVTYENLNANGDVGTGATQLAQGDHTHAQLHDREHTMTGTSDHNATAYRTFYSDVSGDIQELVHGAANTVLVSNGASANPSWATIVGTGTDNRLVRYNGTNAIQQSGITVGDDDQITGVAGITIDNIDIDGNTITTTSGDLVLSSAGDVIITPTGNNVVAGHTASVSIGDAESVIQSLSTDAKGISISRFSANQYGSYLYIGKSRGSNFSTFTILNDNDEIGTIAFEAADGANCSTSPVQILAEVDDDAPAANSIGGALVFKTAAGLASDDIAEKMRIDRYGNVNIPNDSNGTTTNMLQLGAGQDLKLYHDGSDSHIENATGNLEITTAAGSAVVINEASADVDFRVESDNSEYALFVQGSNGAIGFNESVPEGSGLTINQGANDDIIFSLKSTDIAQPDTTAAETDTYFCIRKNSASYGGVSLTGFNSGGGYALRLNGMSGSSSPAVAPIVFNGTKTDGGTDHTSLATSEIIISYLNNGTPKVNILGDGTTNLLVDNAKLQLGAGQDLKLYHDGTNSYAENTTGDLNASVTTSNKCLRAQKAADADFDNTETLSTGITSNYGLMVVKETVDGVTGVFRIEGTTIVDISSNAAFTTTKDNAGTYNVYFDTTAFWVQNLVGDNKAVAVSFYGALDNIKNKERFIMAVKTQKKDLITLWNALHLVKKECKVKFSYFLAKNKLKLKKEIMILNGLMAPSDEYRKFDGERIKLAKKYADKDKKGNPLTTGNEFIVRENRDEFEKEIKILIENHSEVVASREKQLEDYNNLLEEECEFNGHKIKFENLPDMVSSEMLETFLKFDLIIDPDDSEESNKEGIA